MSRIVVFFLFCFSIHAFGQTFSGVVTDEDQNPLAAVLVFNLQTEQKVYTNLKGEFTIDATENNEIRFIRTGFERCFKFIQPQDFNNTFIISIVRTIAEIQEVQINNLNLTGNLNTDARNLTRFDRVAQLQSEIGIPTAPEKPRETPPPTLEKAGIIKYALSNINLNTIYRNISGDGRRMRSLYRYEDLQDNIAWIRERVEDDYFIKMNISKDKISEFLQFSIGLKPDINRWVRARNLERVLFTLEDTFPKYLESKNVK
jgi:hypothetical protein